MTSPSVAGRPAPLGEQRPRICLVPDGPYLETARVAIEVCELAGLSLDEWQRWYLMASLAEREDGKWAAGECGLVVPRQNGKGSIEEGRELTGCSRSTRNGSSSTRRTSRRRRRSISAGCST
jgi:hypothetical protein